MGAGGLGKIINPVSTATSIGANAVGLSKPISQGLGFAANPATAAYSSMYGIGPFSQASQNNPGGLPNLGPQSLLPMMQGGSFSPAHNYGGGPYNAMTNRLAGPQFNPGNPYMMGQPAMGNPGMFTGNQAVPNSLAGILQAMMKHHSNIGIQR